MTAANHEQSPPQGRSVLTITETVRDIATDSSRPASSASSVSELPVHDVSAAMAQPMSVCSECPVLVGTHRASGELVLYLPSVVSAVLVIVGWIVVNKAQANRERRKQIREVVAGLVKDLAELEATMIVYHTNQRDRSKEQAVISRLTRFEKACGLLPKFVESQVVFKAAPPRSLTVCPQAIQQMRKAMTLEHFFDEHKGAIEHADPVIEGIAHATTLVQEALEAVRLAALD